MKIRIISASKEHAVDACQLLRLSIKENCAADHQNDPAKLVDWLSNKTPKNVAIWIEDKQKYSVVAVNESANFSIVGFAMISHLGEVLLCYVHPEYLGQGVGQLMMNSLEAYARDHGLNKVYLESTRVAKSFYEKNGFVSLNLSACRGSLSCLKMEKNFTKEL